MSLSTLATEQYISRTIVTKVESDATDGDVFLEVISIEVTAKGIGQLQAQRVGRK